MLRGNRTVAATMPRETESNAAARLLDKWKHVAQMLLESEINAAATLPHPLKI
jgi:hypothetical protein